MARFLVFDTQATNDSLNDYGDYSSAAALWGTPGYTATGAQLKPITSWVDASTYASPLVVPSRGGLVRMHSMPVRLFGAGGPVDKVTYEFFLTGADQDINICWYQEFFAEQQNPYVARISHEEPLQALYPWTREQVEVVANTGLVTHLNVVRSVTMNAQLNQTGNLQITNVDRRSDSRVFPMVVHGMWTRLRVFSMTALGTLFDIVAYNVDCVATPAPWRLRIFAVVGGYEQVDAMEGTAKLNQPWVSTAVTGPAVWSQAAAIAGTPAATYNGVWPA